MKIRMWVIKSQGRYSYKFKLAGLKPTILLHDCDATKAPSYSNYMKLLFKQQ